MMTKCLAVVMALSASALAADGDPDAPIPVTYKVTRAAGEVLLAGELGVRPSHTAQAERKAGRGPERQQLSVELQALPSGSYSVRASWADTTNDGESVQWSPSVVVKPGAEVELKLQFPGGGRVLKLRVGDKV